ncbi:MAG: hypothetical protein AAF805_02410 [Planctomycetota bacterium]
MTIGLRLPRLLVLLATCLPVAAVEGVTRTFDDGAPDSEWFNAANWDPDGAPAPADELIVNTGVPTTTALVEVSGGGSVRLDGNSAGAALDQLFSGRSGSGSFTVRGGADLATSGFAFVGWFDGSAGDVLLTGNGSTWVADALVGVGRGFNTSATTTGTLTVSDGADFSGAGLEVGGRTLATGTLTVDAASATTSSTITVGAFGSGTANVVNGGTLEATVGGVTIGSGSTGTGSIGTGELFVDGGTVTAAGGMSVGNAGAGLLDVRNGGAVNVGPNTVIVGDAAGAFGQVSLDGDGSSFTGGSSIQVGNRGFGSFEVIGGADVQTGSTFFGVFGPSADGAGFIEGAGSTWTSTGQTGIGFEGFGFVEVTGGGRYNGGQTIIGNEASGDGELLVNEGGFVDGSDVLHVGSRGFGTLTVESAGAVENDGRGAIGVSVGGEGDVTVTDVGSVWTVNNELLVGWSGLGRLTVLDGGVVNSDTGIIAQGIGSSGEATVSGPGATWDNTNDLSVGSLGDGVLAVTDGGTVTAVNGLIGASTDATGSVFVGDLNPAGTATAPAVWELAESLYVGGPSFGAGGPGDLTIAAEGEVRVANETVVWSTGELDLEGGLLKTGDLDVSAGVFRFTGGTLTADTVTGDVLNEGGTVAPGASPGATTIAGDYTQQAGATLQIELGGLTPATEYDQLTVDGATLDLAGTLELVHLAGTSLGVGDQFEVVTFTGALIGAFDAVSTASEDGLLFDVAVNYGPAAITVEVLSVTLPLAGDYNGDGTVDAADYTVWRDNEGMPAGTLINDVDGGMIGVDQYNTWVANFGATASATATPEPTGAATMVLGALVSLRRRARRLAA